MLKINDKMLIGVYLILSLLIVTNITMCHKKNKYKKDVENLTQQINDTITTIYNKNSSTVNKTSLIVDEAFRNIATKDSTIQALQEQVEKYSSEIKNNGSVTNTKIVTKWRTRIKTQTVFLSAIDTVIIDNNDTLHEVLVVRDTIYPTYNSDFNLDGWVKGKISANRDSTKIDVSVKNDYTIVLGEERKNIFSAKKQFVLIHSLNPYSEIKDLKSYKAIKNKTRFNVGPYVGFGVGSNFKIVPQIGVGLNYELIKF